MAIIPRSQATRSPADRWPEYLRQSRLPLASLAFVLPLLVLYEGGVLLLGQDASRNGADVWLRSGLNQLGLAHYFLLPLLTVGLLLSAQHVSAQPWRFAPTALYGMILESLLWALPLLVAAAGQRAVFQEVILRDSPVEESRWAHCALVSDGPGQLIAFAGAGIYEEALFRLALLPLAAGGLQLLGSPRRASLAAAVMLTSLAFAAAHHLGPHSEPLAASSFLFRTAAGGFFAAVFLTRGFGIAAGAHAAYDVLLGLA
jgi:hypothetical protein